MKSIILKPIAWIFLLLISLHSIVNIFWLAQNNAPMPWDSANHLYISIEISEKIRNFDILGIFKVSNYYPIFVHTITGIILTFTGIHLKFAQFLGSLYFFLTLLIIYLYTQRLYKSHFISIFTAIVFSFFPVIFNWSRFLMLDIPSVGTFVLTLYFLDKSKNLHDRKYTVLSFISAGLLALTKWTPLLYLVVPAIFFVSKILKSDYKVKALYNIGFGILSFLAVILPWYGTNLKEFLFLAETYSVDHSSGSQINPLSLDNFLLYFKILYRDQITPVTTIIFIICLGVFLTLKKNIHKFYISSLLLVSYLLFSLIGNKDSRFTMHLLVFVAMIIAVVFKSLIDRKKYLGVLTVTIFLSYLLGMFFLLSFRSANLEGYKLSYEVPILGQVHFLQLDDFLVKKYDSNIWSMDKLISDLKPLSDSGGGEILVVSEWRHFNPSNIRTYTKVSGLTNLQIITADIVFLKMNYYSDKFPDFEKVEEFLAKKKYIVSVSRDIGSPILLNKKAVEQLKTYIDATSLSPCRQFEFEIAPPSTRCVVRVNEVLQSSSDIIINDNQAEKGQKNIIGFALVDCPFGCSFTSNTAYIPKHKLEFETENEYILPNKEVIKLIRVNKLN